MNPYVIGGSAAAGAIGGGYSAYQANKAERKALSKYMTDLEAMGKESTALSSQRLAELGQQYSPYTQGFQDTANRYYDTLGKTDYTKFNVSAPEDFQFDYQGEIQKQLNPELEAIISRSSQGVEQSAANAGQLFSGATGKAIARSTADIQAKEWDTAAQRAQQQQQSKYQQYIDKFNNALRANEVNKGNLQANVQNLGSLYGAQSSMYQNQIGQEQELKAAADLAKMQGMENMANARYQRAKLPSGFSAALGGALSGAGSAASFASQFGGK